ncbi:MAG: alanine racemase [Candidatus Omnitrophota bacterium]
MPRLSPEVIGYRPTWAEINLRNLAYNFSRVKTMLNPGTKVMVCVKADAYGHGLVPVSKKLSSCGVDYLSVASIDEGIALRRAGIKKPILVLGMILKTDARPLIEYNLSQTVCTLELASALNSIAASKNRKINIHVKVDTGMGRLGILPKDASVFIKKVRRMRSLNIEGLFTHISCADTNRDFTSYQIGIFDRLADKLAREGLEVHLLHAANSLGVIDYPKSHFNMVRPGLVIYGLYPKEKLYVRLKPVLSLKTRVVYSKDVPRGFGISYGRTYITKRNTTVATLPIGYGDGYPRNLSNIAPVLIKGRRFTLSGRVCMDQVMVDVGGLKVRIGDEAVLIGSQGSCTVSAEELSALSGTIPYEIVCGLGSRVPRVYLE